jgi:hypothetical protein
MKSFLRAAYCKTAIQSLVLFLGVFLLAFSCPHEDPECVNMKITPYLWDSVFTENLNNSSEIIFVSSDHTIPKAAYGIRLNFEIQPYASVPAHTDSCIHLIAGDTINTIKIYTVYDFDASHPAYSDISDYFKVGETPENAPANGFSYSRFSSINNYLTAHSDQTLFKVIDFLLVAEPQLNTIHEFKIELVKNNSSDFIPVHQVTLY